MSRATRKITLVEKLLRSLQSSFVTDFPVGKTSSKWWCNTIFCPLSWVQASRYVVLRDCICGYQIHTKILPCCHKNASIYGLFCKAAYCREYVVLSQHNWENVDLTLQVTLWCISLKTLFSCKEYWLKIGPSLEIVQGCILPVWNFQATFGNIVASSRRKLKKACWNRIRIC